MTFYVCKTICFLVQLLFFGYELVQIKSEKREYFEDTWNYAEVGGIFLFSIAAILDILNETVTDTVRILWTFSILFSLIKIVYLIRVFQQLNFLVTMLITVVNEVMYFLLLFSAFILTFA